MYGRRVGAARRRSVVLAVGAVVVAGLATFTAFNPFHLVQAGTATAVLVSLTIVLLTLGAANALRRPGGRIAVAVLGVLVLAGWCAAVWFAARFAGPQRVVTEATGGGYQLVVVEGRAFVDPVYSVHLRRGSGLVAQDSLVWQGLADGAPPSQVRFRGDPAVDQQVEVVAGPGCGYRSRFDTVTLDVDPVHRPLRLDGC